MYFTKSLRQFVGTASCLALFAGAAGAQSVSTEEDLTAPVQSSTADAGIPADFTLETGGSIIVTNDTVFSPGLEGAAFVLDSSNTLTNSGLIDSDATPGATGVLVLTGSNGITASIVNAGIISGGVPGDATLGEGSNFGLVIEGDGSFTGTIIGNTGSFFESSGTANPISVDFRAPVVGSPLDVDGNPDTPDVVTAFGNAGIISALGPGATGIRIGSDVTGTIFSGLLSVGSFDIGDATGILVDEAGEVDNITISGASAILAVGDADTEVTAIGVDIAGQITSETDAPDLFIGAGLLVTATGEGSRAIGILDQGNGIDTITIADGITVETSGGAASIAIDVSQSTLDVSILNEGVIIGDILTGSGSDTLTLNGGSVTGAIDLGVGNNSILTTASAFSGDVRFGNGDDSISLSGSVGIGAVDFGSGTDSFSIVSLDVGTEASPSILRSQFIGSLVGAGILDVTVIDSDLGLSGVAGASVTTLSLDDTSTLTQLLFPVDGSAATIRASDTVSLASGLAYTVSVDGLPFEEQSFVLIDAGTIALNGFDPSNIGTDLSPILFDVTTDFIDGDSDLLTLTITPVDPETLGLTTVQADVLDGLIDPVNGSSDLGAAIAGLPDLASVQSALSVVAPQSSGASRTAALSYQTATFGALNRRMASLRDFKRYEDFLAQTAPERSPGSIYRERNYSVGIDERKVAFWGQEVTNFFDRDATDEAPGFNGFTLNFFGGADIPLFGLDAVGLAAGYAFTEVTDEGFSDGNLFARIIQVGTYLSHSIGGAFIDISGTIAFNDFENTRDVVIDDPTTTAPSFSGVATGNWNALQYSAQAQLGYEWTLGRFGFGLSGQASYVRLEEDAYEEAGPAEIAFAISDRDTESLRVAGRFRVDALYRFGRNLVIQPQIRGGIIQEVLDDPVVTEARFINAASSFFVEAAVPETTSFFGGLGVSSGFNLGSVSLDYDFEFADDIVTHAVGVTLRFAF